MHYLNFSYLPSGMVFTYYLFAGEETDTWTSQITAQIDLTAKPVFPMAPQFFQQGRCDYLQTRGGREGKMLLLEEDGDGDDWSFL